MNQTLIKHAVITAGIMVVFSLVGTALLAFTHESTKGPIAASEIAKKMKEFDEVLPSSEHNNSLTNDTVKIPQGGELGNREDTLAYIAKLDGKPQAVILETTAHDGYSGDIKLLLAVRVNGTVAGVRVITHKETPGLGDYIDIAHGNWIKSFDGLSITTRPDMQWKVKKDGGQFDYMAGATITPRAVVKAVHQAVTFVGQHQSMLFADAGKGE